MEIVPRFCEITNFAAVFHFKPKQIKVNGTTATRTEGQANSAEVIITQDTNSSGVVKKPGFSGSSAVSFLH